MGTGGQCDNAAPACSNCASSKASCVYNTYPTSYVHRLEERVGELEARLRSVDPSQADDHLADDMHNDTQTQIATPSSIPSTHQVPAMASSPGHLASGIGLLSSCATAEPHYFGFSSGLNLAHFVEAAVTANNEASEINLPLLADRPFSRQIPTAQTPLAPVPISSIGNRYIRAYLASIQPLYPFIDEKDIWRMHRSATGDAPSTSESLTKADLARLHLIYAIGSRCTQILKPRKIQKHVPEGHLMSAMQHIPEVLKLTSTHTVEVTLLLAIHSMRSPSGMSQFSARSHSLCHRTNFRLPGTSVWHLCGFAMRLCLELGLHRPKPYQSHQAHLEQQRRKLFWSVYIFERKSALILGRPFAVSDKDIALSMLDDGSDEENSSSPASSIVLLRNHVLLYQIHSKIRSTLHHLRSEAPSVKIAEKVASCLQRLEVWRSSMLQEVGVRVIDTASAARPATTRSHSDSSDSADDTSEPLLRHASQDRAELLLEYHKARRSLLQPLLTDSGSQYSPTLSDYSACADASSQICQHYRLLHRLSAWPFTLRDLHAVLIAGFTWLHCIAARPALYNARNAGAIGACSTVLYLIAEQWSGARKYRDTFEIVADKLVAKVNETQSEFQTGSFEYQGATGNASAYPNSDLQSHGPHDRSTEFQAASRDTILSQSETGRPMNQSRDTLFGDMAPTEGSANVDECSELDLHNMFGSIVEDTFASFNADYADDSLRELLANEGLDWFSKG